MPNETIARPARLTEAALIEKIEEFLDLPNLPDAARPGVACACGNDQAMVAALYLIAKRVS